MISYSEFDGVYAKGAESMKSIMGPGRIYMRTDEMVVTEPYYVLGAFEDLLKRTADSGDLMVLLGRHQLRH
jgi:hypothetical protein